MGGPSNETCQRKEILKKMLVYLTFFNLKFVCHKNFLLLTTM